MDVSTEAKKMVIKFHKNLVDNLCELLEKEVIEIDMRVGDVLKYCNNEIKKFKSNSTT